MDFIHKYTVGFETYKEEALKWTPEAVTTCTGIPWVDVESLAKLYATLKPSATMIGIGMQKSTQGAEATRAVALLSSLVGQHRGFFYSNGDAAPINRTYLCNGATEKPPPDVVSVVGLGKILKEGRFKFVFVSNMNPAMTLPDSNSVFAGLMREDVYVVVHDTVWTETARFASVVLPAASHVEKVDLVVPWTHHWLLLNPQLAKPWCESRDEIWLMRELASRMSVTDSAITEDPMSAIRVAFRDALTPDDLERLFAGKRVPLKWHPADAYQTASGKLELASRAAVAAGALAVPQQLPTFTRTSPREFVLVNSSSPLYLHTQFRSVYGPPPSTICMNPRDAAGLGLGCGDRCRVSSKQGGDLVATLSLTDMVVVGTLWATKEACGLCGRPQNVLTSPHPQKIGGGPTFNSTVVFLTKDS
eukprot:TRINITY_DN6604_c0_g2_i2.p1 TRINITY_DN6604_c0_g2~~TRINITY_DN6604_c0_g2_i2.p1  ORF type:complete len:418 (+),score=77.52 TRINITY_DN6604_c0_g2_i2:428-1681(+)